MVSNILRGAVVIAASAALASGCAIPHGSIARPFSPVEKGTMVIGGGAILPFAFAGKANAGEDSASFSAVTDGFSLIPVGSFDVGLTDSGTTIGTDVSYLAGLGPSGAQGLFINPRFEASLIGDELDRYLSFTADLNLGWFNDGDGSLFYFSPTVGMRAYIPVYQGGFIVSQSIGTAFITVTLPGGIGYDIDLDWIHIVPEFHWDPSFFFIGDFNGSFVIFSAGGSVLFEI